MSNVFSKFNTHQDRIDWGVDTTGFKFYKLKEVYDEGSRVLDCNGLFITKGNYGYSAVAIGNDRLYNLPSHKVEAVRAMLADDDCVNAIRARRLSLRLVPYKNRTGRDCVDCVFVERRSDGSTSDTMPLF